MSLFEEIGQGIIDAFFQEGDNWKERIGDATITLTSPETSTEFSAKWIENTKAADKKVGLFDYPNIQGTVSQDLATSSNRFSITFRFTDYENNDLFARDFYAVAAKEKGQWAVVHPSYGYLGLQLLSIRETRYADEGGYTEFSTEWIESIDEDKLLTSRELAGLVDGQCSLVQLNSIEQFVAACDQTSRALRAVIENTVDGIGNVVDFVLSPVFAVEDLVSSAITSIKLGIQGSIDAVLLPLAELAGQLQNLINLPLLASRDTKKRIKKYDELRLGIFSLLPGENVPSQNSVGGSITKTWSTDLEKKNNIATAELASISSIVAFSQILLTANDIKSRTKALDLSQQLIDAFSELTTAYDTQQENQEEALLENQYFSNSAIYTDLVTLIALTLKYMQSLIGDLQIEKKIVLDRPRSVAELCISEYGTLDKYDELIENNKLKSSEILWLPTGKEIVVSL